MTMFAPGEALFTIAADGTVIAWRVGNDGLPYKVPAAFVVAHDTDQDPLVEVARGR